MVEKLVPMIHVPDVRATVDWYKTIGFTVRDTYGDGGEGLSFAILSFGSSEVMFNSGGRPDARHRRDVDLYVYTNDVDDMYERLKDRVEVVEGPHDTFYGMREFIFRDLNRFWMTFAEVSPSEVLMSAVLEGNTELVRSALEHGALKPETLTRALAASASDNKNVEIADMLKKAGAVLPAEVDAEILQSYVGWYRGEQGFQINVTLKDGKLFAAPGGDHPMSLMAEGKTTFKPTAFDGYGTITFNVEAGKTMGCALTHGGNTTHLKRVEVTERS